MGFAEGLAAGSSAASKWVDAYTQAHDRYLYAQAAQQTDAPPTIDENYLTSTYGMDPATAQATMQQIRANPAGATDILNNYKLSQAKPPALPGSPAAADQAAGATPGVQVGAPLAAGSGVATQAIPGGPAPTPGAAPATGLTPPAAATPPPSQGTGAPMGYSPPPAAGAPPLLDAQGGVSSPAVPPANAAPPAPAQGLTPPPAASGYGGAAPPASAAGGPPAAPPAAPAAAPPAAAAPQPANAPVAANAPAPTIAGLSAQQFNDYTNNVAGTEQDPDKGYTSTNSAGFLGKYQMGAGALQDAGYIKPGVNTKDNAALNDPNNWTGKDGAKDRTTFLTTPAAQDNAFKTYTDGHYQQLKDAGIIKDDTPPDQIAGLLKGAHLGGVQGVVNYVNNGVDRADSNGTKISQYIAQGSKALTGGTDNTAGQTPTQVGQQATTPPTAQALQTPEGKQEATEDLNNLTKLSERVFVDPRTKFNVDAQGKITMQGPQNDSDAFLRMSRVAIQLGDADKAKKAFDSYLSAKSDEATKYVNNVMKSNMTDDQKVAALIHGTGIPIYKADDGQYVSPALSGPAVGGQYKRMSMSDIGMMAQQLTTQEGIKTLIGYQQKNQEMAQKGVELKQAGQKQALEEKKAAYEENAAIPGSPAALRVAQAGYYGDRLETAQAIADTKAQAARDVAAAHADAAAARAGQKQYAEVVPPSGNKATWTLTLPDGKGGTTLMEGARIPTEINAGGQGGLVLDSEAAKAPDIRKQLDASPWSQVSAHAAGSPSYIEAVVPSPIQPTMRGGKWQMGGSENAQSGRIKIASYGMNPATKKMEPMVMVNGKPNFGWTDPKTGILYPPYADDVKSAEQNSQEYAEYMRKQQPEKPGMTVGDVMRSPGMQQALQYSNMQP